MICNIQFKSWDEMVQEYGIIDGIIPCRFTFTSEMRYLCGKTFYGVKVGNRKVGPIRAAEDFTISTDMVHIIPDIQEKLE